MPERASERILGLDIGASSVGWALIERSLDRSTGQIVALGSRVFPTGVDLGKSGLEALTRGTESSLAATRRAARQLRRQTSRRRKRVAAVSRLLVEAGLLPDLGSTPDERREAIVRLDLSLDQKFPAKDPQSDAGLPYRLRAAALAQPLPEHALGRVFLHLAQRRGFLSNRKTKKREDDGKVSAGISALDSAMQETGSRTLGELFARTDPHEHRIRKRYTSRAQYITEFDAIVKSQSEHHPALQRTSFVRKLRHRLFFQRPLKSARKLIGRCTVEKNARRCAFSLPSAQEFRLLQKVNDLRGITTDGEIRELNQVEREAVILLASAKSTVTFSALRKAVKKANPSGDIKEFNFERGGETALKGMDSIRRIREAAPRLVNEEEGKLDFDEMVQILCASDSIEVTKRDVHRHYPTISTEEAGKLAETSFEEGYAAYSRRALRKLLPHLRNGIALQTAVKAEYGVVPFEAMAILPSVHSLFGRLPAPAVTRALTEMRKVVNGVVREHGLPDRMVVELASDLKRPKSERERINTSNNKRRKERGAAKEELISEASASGIVIAHPTRADIDKMLLLRECGNRCPYTGRSLTVADVFGPHPNVDVEHIIPYALSLDDSFANKTLCDSEENRRKARRTPWQAYHTDTDKYEAIIQRVSRFEGDGAAKRKLALFQRKDEDLGEEFLNRHLNDTRYASGLAKEYLERLYGRSQGGEHPAVNASTGAVTATLRRSWDFESILGGSGKTRSDHRHHAVDAVVLALTDSDILARLRAKSRDSSYRPGKKITLDQPWERAKRDLGTALESVVVSHRVDRKIQGPLHAETLYAERTEGNVTSVRVRKLLTALTKDSIDHIIDPVVRATVKSALGGEAPEKFFSVEANLPRMPAPLGGRAPLIRAVRVRMTQKPFLVGAGSRQRRVTNTENHHAVVWAGEDDQLHWEVVSKFVAHQRLSQKLPVVERSVAPGRTFTFSLCSGDCLRVNHEGRRVVVVVRGISEGDIECTLHSDARTSTERRQAGERIRYTSPRSLTTADPEKVLVSPTGSVTVQYD